MAGSAARSRDNRQLYNSRGELINLLMSRWMHVGARTRGRRDQGGHRICKLSHSLSEDDGDPTNQSP